MSLAKEDGYCDDEAKPSAKQDGDGGWEDSKGSQAGQDYKAALRSTIAHFTEDWLDFSNEDMMELFEWETRHWHLFEPEDEEHSLQHTELHAQYSALFEAKLEAYIASKEGISVGEFYELVRSEMERAEGKDGEDGGEAMICGQKQQETGNLGVQLLRVVHKAMDFGAWAASMRKCVEDQRRLDDVD